MDFSHPAPWHFFYRFVMVVRTNVLEYIIAFVVVKNKVGLRVECTLFCNIQNLLVIGLYELLGNNPNEAHKEIPTQVKHTFGTIYKRVNT